MIEKIFNRLGYIKGNGKVKGLNYPRSDIKDLIIPGTGNNLAQYIQGLQSGSGITDPYTQSVWVYSCVQTIASNISRIPFNFYQKNDQGKRDPVDPSPLDDLFNQPNPYMTRSQLFESTMVFLGIRGECLWILDEPLGNTSIPASIWVFDPVNFEPVKDDRSGQLIGWSFNGHSGKVRIPLEQIIHFKYFNPRDPIRGLSPIQAVMDGVDMEFYANQFNKNFFKRGAVTSMVFETDQELDNDVRKQMIEMKEDFYSGYDKAHRIMVLEGGLKLKDIRISQKDMEFIELKKLTRKEIFSAFKVNEVVLGVYEDVKSFEGTRTAHRQFWQECLIPKINHLEWMLWSRMFRHVDGGRIFGEFDLGQVEALQDNQVELADLTAKYFQMGVPFNTLNDRFNLGFDPIPYGDQGYLPGGMIPIEMAGQSMTFGYDDYNAGGTTPTPNPEPEPAEPMEPDDTESKGGNIPAVHATDWKQRSLVQWRKYINLQNPLERQIQKKLKRYFFEQRKQVLEKLSTVLKKDIVDQIYDQAEQTRKLQEMMKPLWVKGIETGEIYIANLVHDDAFRFDPLSQDVLKYTQDRMELMESITGLTTDKLRDTLADGIQAGESIGDLSVRVRDVYNFNDIRTARIARTESAVMIQTGKNVQMKKEGVEKHRWITARDEAVRDTHVDLDNQTAIVGDYFTDVYGMKTDLRFPSDPLGPAEDVINCRCDTYPVLD